MNGRLTRLVAVVVAAILIPAIAAGQPNLEGLYMSRGVNPDGSEYRGAVHIVQQGDRFIVTWMSLRAAGERLVLELTSVGVGIKTGETLAVSYTAGDTTGIVVYRIGEDGQLAGRWTIIGDDQVHSETLTKLVEPVPGEPGASDPLNAPTPPRRRAPHPVAGTIAS